MSCFINNTSENGVNQFAPFSIIAKPVGSTCNLRCKYCYYIDKASELGYSGKTIMTLETLENYIKKYILSHPEGHRVDFIWHGGEATILPLGFYKKAVELQIKYSSNRIISNSLQTNGTLLNDEWCRFLKKNNWLVGISIDGDMDVHDEYRKTETGKGSFLRVMRGIRLLNRYGIEWNAMAVVNDFCNHSLEHIWVTFWIHRFIILLICCYPAKHTFVFISINGFIDSFCRLN